MLQPIPFARHSYVDASLPISAQRLINWYLAEKPQDAKNAVALLPTPGLRPWVVVGGGPIRGLIGMGPYLFVVSGAQCYRVDQFGTAQLAGSVAGFRTVSMAHDGLRVVIVSDTDIYWASANGFGQLDIPPCVGVAVHDGYFLFAQRNSQRFFISDITAAKVDGSGNALPPQFNGTEFAEVNAYPDNNTAIVNSNRETWIFGERSAQIYYDSGQLDFPFSRMSGGVLQRGCLASRSVAEFQGSLFWLGDDKRVYTSSGSAPSWISTDAIDAQIAGYELPEESVGFTYSQSGHIFYVLMFNETTWCFDLVTGLWHERQSKGLNNWRVQCFEGYFDRLIVGDRLNGNLYNLDVGLYSENNEGLVRTATSPPLNGRGFWATMSHFFLDIETGVGLNSGQGMNPKVMLDWSDDGGFTYGNELWRTAGNIGDFRHRVEWRRLGRFKQRTLRIRISDPVKPVIIQAYADIEGGEP